MEVSHPCLGRAPPSIPALLEIADPPARRVLLRASALGRARVEGARALARRAQELARGLWLEPPLLERVPPERLIMTDLLRALLVEETDAIAALLPGGIGERFAGAVEALARPAGAASQPRDDHLPIEPGWGRRWTLAEATEDFGRAAGRVTVTGLLRWLDLPALHALGELDAARVAGELTAGESQARCAGRLIERAGPLLEEVPPAYLDRHGGLAALDRDLARAPGVALVGAEGSGRRALAEAWGWRLRAGGGPPALAGWRLRVARYFAFADDERARWPKACGPGPRVIVLDPREGDMAFDTRDARWSRMRELVEVLGASARRPASALRVLAIVTEGELAELLREAPSARSLARVDVPPAAPLDRIPLWMCGAMARPRLGLDAVLTVARYLGDEFATRAPWRLHDGEREALELWRLEQRPREALRRQLERGRGPAWRRLARYIGDRARWQALTRLDARLHADLAP